MSNREINSVSVLGAGTMGSGIAAACAQAGCNVLLLDVTSDQAEQGKANMLKGRAPMLDDPASADLITTGSFDDSLSKVESSDWICEAIIENLEAKRDIFSRLNPLRKAASIVTTNTSGIPLRSITEGMPEDLRRDIAVTHFFNPVKVMKLLEIVPGEDTTPDVIETLAQFSSERLNKGVVYAKDTVNFIGNRIGCFWMLAGLHKGKQARSAGATVEQIDAAMAGALGIPPTGLFGLIDLVGLDVMDLVAKNLANNLSADDVGRKFCELPSIEQQMLANGQVGRKSGGGYYRMLFNDDGSKQKQMYFPEQDAWQNVEGVRASVDDNIVSVTSQEGVIAQFARSLVFDTLCYTADLIPEIAEDIVNVDRAMRWGFNWAKGPFELIDEINPFNFVEQNANRWSTVPAMLKILMDSDNHSFYSEDGTQYLGVDGQYHPIPN